ncbi:MAG: CBS domain-containing protein [Rhodothermales bacterium]|nr:CBS domain-containing protein [Rhodothermales bacterium]
MTFMVQGLNIHEMITVEQLFRESGVKKIQSIAPTRSTDDSEKSQPVNRNDNPDKGRQSAMQGRAGAAAYNAIDELPRTTTILHADQIMTSSVVTLSLRQTVSDTLAIFQENAFHHLPVVGDDNRLAGIVSDRDILRYFGGISADYHLQAPNRSDRPVEKMMQSPVLTASRVTDVRYIARLFVDQRIGSMPIVTEGTLVGIVTRSDVLSAVMRNFVLELWA